MDIEFLIERLERFLLVESPKILGNRAINEDETRKLLNQLKESVPGVIQEARKIVAERDAVLHAARHEADGILAAARVEGEKIISDHQFVVDARRQANLIVSNAQSAADRLRTDADEYAFDVLSMLMAELNRQLKIVENGLERLETTREQTPVK